MLRKTKKKLESMYHRERQKGDNGKLYEIDGTTRITAEQGHYLAALHEHYRSELSVEIGVAFGFSTLFILDSKHENNYGSHIAIDPLEHSTWNGVGLFAVKKLGFDARFNRMCMHSVHALTKLDEADVTTNYIYIDGNHTFDAALMDFCCADRILAIDGITIFDDMWMPSIRKVSSFIEKNISSCAELATSIPNLLCLQKPAQDEREWNHYEDF